MQLKTVHIKNRIEFNKEKSKKELIESYYGFMLNLAPDGVQKPSLEEFIKELETPEAKAELEEQFKIILSANADINLTMNIVAEDPYISNAEMKTQLEIRSNKQ